MEFKRYVAEAAANFTFADFDEFASGKTKKPSPFHTNSTYCVNYMSNNTVDPKVDIERFAFSGLCLWSIAGLIFVAITIFRNKKLQAHPQMLIAYICMAEACMSYNALIQVIGPVLFSCYFGLEQIFSYTVPNQSMTEDGLESSLNLLCNSNGVTF